MQAVSADLLQILKRPLAEIPRVSNVLANSRKVGSLEICCTVILVSRNMFNPFKWSEKNSACYFLIKPKHAFLDRWEVVCSGEDVGCWVVFAVFRLHGCGHVYCS